MLDKSASARLVHALGTNPEDQGTEMPVLNVASEVKAAGQAGVCTTGKFCAAAAPVDCRRGAPFV